MLRAGGIDCDVRVCLDAVIEECMIESCGRECRGIVIRMRHCRGDGEGCGVRCVKCVLRSGGIAQPHMACETWDMGHLSPVYAPDPFHNGMPESESVVCKV